MGKVFENPVGEQVIKLFQGKWDIGFFFVNFNESPGETKDSLSDVIWNGFNGNASIQSYLALF